MRLQWGVGILLVLILFLIALGVMVYIAMDQKVDLVSDDYYRQALNHQERIDESNRSANLHEKVGVRVEDASLIVIFPPKFLRNELSGALTFYRPADRSRDLILPLGLDSTNSQTVITSSFDKGLWRFKAVWEYEKEKYYYEEVVVIR